MLILTASAGAGYFGWQLWQGNRWDLSALSSSSLHADSGEILDKFNSSDSASDAQISDSEIIPLLKPISAGPSSSAVNGSRNDEVLFYQMSDGSVHQVYALDGSSEVISKTKLPGFVRAIWSPDKQSVISLFSTPAGGEYRYYNYTTRASARLPVNVQSVAFSPDSSQIVYFATSGDLGGIYLAGPDGANSKKILATRIPSMQLFWPSAEHIYFQTRNISTGGWNLVAVSTDGVLTDILNDRLGLEVVWSRDGQKVLYSDYTNDTGLRLFYRDLTDSSQSETPVSAPAYAWHCAWSVTGATVYCGIPEQPPTAQQLAAGAILNDSIYKISLSSGMKELLFKQKDPSAGLRVQDAFLSPLEDYFFFTNTFDGRIYGLPLAQ